MIPSMGERCRRRKALGWLALFGLGIAALVLLRFLGPGGSPPSPTGEGETAGSPFIGGRILLASRKPAAGAKVEAILEAGGPLAMPLQRSTTTAADGSFEIPRPPLGMKIVGVRATLGHLTWEVTTTPFMGPAEFEILLADSYPVSGLAIAAEDGRPLEGMDVRLGERAARTDRLGRFSFPSVPAEEAPKEVVVSGAGRKTLRRALPSEGGLDDLLLRVEGE